MAKGKTYTEKKDVRVDFTPMVDMNMLLITFFMLCTTMIKSQTLQISLPSNEKVEKQEQNKVKQSEAITIILDGQVSETTGEIVPYVYYFEGMPEVVSVDESNLKEIAFLPNENGNAQGIRAVLRDRNKQVVEKIEQLKVRWRNKEINDSVYKAEAKVIRNDSTLTRPVIIIKATKEASYGNLVAALDEMQVNNISRYQIDRMNATDTAMLLPYWKKRGVIK